MSNNQYEVHLQNSELLSLRFNNPPSVGQSIVCKDSHDEFMTITILKVEKNQIQARYTSKTYMLHINDPESQIPAFSSVKISLSETLTDGDLFLFDDSDHNRYLLKVTSINGNVLNCDFVNVPIADEVANPTPFM